MRGSQIYCRIDTFACNLYFPIPHPPSTEVSNHKLWPRMCVCLFIVTWFIWRLSCLVCVGGADDGHTELSASRLKSYSRSAARLWVRRECNIEHLWTLCMHAHEGYSSLSVSVCPHSSASLQRACNKLYSPVGSLPNSKGFQLTDFAKMLSFPSYSLFSLALWRLPFTWMEPAEGCRFGIWLYTSMELATVKCTRLHS